MQKILSLIGVVRLGFQKVFGKVRRFDNSMRKRYRPKRLAIVATAALAISVILQLFIPPYLGMSNDGSYDTVLQDVGLVELKTNERDRYFNYYVRTYGISTQVNPPDTTPWPLRAVVRLAISLDMLMTRDAIFDMRSLAVLYTLAYLLVSFLLVESLLSRISIYSEGVAISVVCVLVLGDTSIVTRLASLYTQPLEWILFIGIVDAVTALARKGGGGLGSLALFVQVCLLMALNRYAALAGLVFSLIYWRMMGLKLDAPIKIVHALMAVSLSVLSVVMTMNMLNTQTIYQKYDQMTRGVLFEASNPEKALANFGIEPRFSILTDTYSDQSFPIAEMDIPALEDGFFDRYTTKDVAVYYLSHPTAMWGLFDVGVHNAFSSRPSYSGNFEKSVGLPARAKSPFPALWSTFKEQVAPKTVGSVFIILMIVVLLRRKKSGANEGWVALNRSLMLVVWVFPAVELGTVLVMSGDSELIREGFLMGVGIDVLVLTFLTEILHRTKIISDEKG